MLANRLWQYHFGRGIVPTPNDFGGLGEPATHPELLDWLAAELIDGGWRLKRMHRMIVLSSAYRMSSRATPGRAGRRPIQPLVLAIPDAAAHGRGSARLDPGGRRHAQLEGRRAAGLSADSARGAGRPVGARAGVGGLAAGGIGPAKRLRSRQAIASGARSWRRTMPPTPTSVARCATRRPCPPRPLAS